MINSVTSINEEHIYSIILFVIIAHYVFYFFISNYIFLYSYQQKKYYVYKNNYNLPTSLFPSIFSFIFDNSFCGSVAISPNDDIIENKAIIDMDLLLLYTSAS